MPKKLIGHVACPECNFPDAEVGEDKNGHPYRFCPDCNAQYFTRGDEIKVKNLRAKMRPLTGLPNEPPKPADPPPPPQKGESLSDWYAKNK